MRARVRVAVKARVRLRARDRARARLRAGLGHLEGAHAAARRAQVLELYDGLLRGGVKSGRRAGGSSGLRGSSGGRGAEARV